MEEPNNMWSVTELFDNKQVSEEEKKHLINQFVESSNGIDVTHRCFIFSSVLNFMLVNDRSMWSIPLYASITLGNKQPKDLLLYLGNENFYTTLKAADPNKLTTLLVWLTHCFKILIDCIGEKINLPKMSTILFEKMEENKSDSSVVSKIASLLVLCPALIPNGQKAFKISNTILYIVADFPMPTTPQTLKHMVEIGNLINILWNRLSLDNLKTSLAILYHIVSTSDSPNEVCPAIAHVLSLVSEPVVTTLAPRLITSVHPANSLSFTTTLTRLSNWLIYWPLAANTLNFWIKTLVQLLYQSGKCMIPKNTAIQQICKLIEALRIPVCRHGAFEGILTFLMSYQLSADIFIQVIPQLRKIVTILKRENTAESNETLSRVYELCVAQMSIHLGHENIYEGLLDQFKDLPRPNEENTRTIIETYTWAAAASRDLENCKTYCPGLEIKSRGITEKIGLQNLGNTCYMNAIIQALFMTDSLRTSIIQSKMKFGQPLLTNMRQLFALLCFSKRSYIAPRFFHNSSRPPWFQSGIQHDCSEYLRHLLTALSEEEKLAVPSEVIEQMHTNSETASLSSDNILPDESEFECLDKHFNTENLETPPYSASQKFTRGQPMEFETSNEISNGDLLDVNADKELVDQDVLFHQLEAVDCMEFENSVDSFHSCKRKKTSPELTGSPSGKIMKGDLQTSSETDSASDSGISGDLTEEKDYGLISNPDGSDNLQSVNSPLAKEEFTSLVHKIFGGKLSCTTTCFNCQKKSVHKDIFTDINLKFQDSYQIRSPVNKNDADNDSVELDLTIEQMIDDYLQPETLSGENQYMCSRCNSMQDAEQCVEIVEPPDHLILTLGRMSYDRTLRIKEKMFTKVNFAEELSIPVCQVPVFDARDVESYLFNTDPKKRHMEKTSESYTLYAVVVHSGISSEGGHYYCFARSSSLALVQPRERERCGDLGNWYNFNDENVTQTDFGNIYHLTGTHDTAYLLFYQKVGDLKYPNVGSSIENKNNLQADIKEVIENDNKLFQSEIENMTRKSNITLQPKNNRQDPPPPPPGNCGDGGGADISPSIIY